MVIKNQSIARAAALTSHEKVIFSMVLYHLSPYFTMILITIKLDNLQRF